MCAENTASLPPLQLTVVDLGGPLEGGRDVVSGGGPLPVQVRAAGVGAQVATERAVCNGKEK